MDRHFFGTDAEARVIAELEQELAARIQSANRQWDSGTIDPQAEPVTDDFIGIQYAPWYPEERFTVDAEGWREGNQHAAQEGLGKGWHWTVRDAHFLPRSEDEAIVVYTVVHHWADPAEPPGEAAFLETWVRQGGRWALKRHTAEKR